MSLPSVPTSIHLRQNTHHNKGQIQVIFGPMFSGKTTELLRRIKRYQVAKYKCAVIKYENDKRYDADDVSTHDRQTYKAISAGNLNQVRSKVQEFEVIGVDEGQFFPDVVQFCEDMAKLKKTVIVAALDGDYLRKPFGNIIDLVPLAESVVKLSAVCMNCYGEGSFTKRICGGTQLEVIGGTDKYMAACRECHENINAPLSTVNGNTNHRDNAVEEEKPNNNNNNNCNNNNIKSPRKVLHSVENFSTKSPYRNMENHFA